MHVSYMAGGEGRWTKNEIACNTPINVVQTDLSLAIIALTQLVWLHSVFKK